jgi:hypothetical protein
VLREVGGWTQVLDRFESNYIVEMDRYSHRFMVLLIDCDGQQERLNDARVRIPERLEERVFILGALTNPESLRADLGSYETIGLKLAKDCREETSHAWGHRLLQHNVSEIDRLRRFVRPILFPNGG